MQKINKFLLVLYFLTYFQGVAFAQGDRPSQDKAKAGDFLFCSFSLDFESTGLASAWDDRAVLTSIGQSQLEGKLDSENKIPGNLRFTVAYVSGNPVPAPRSPEGDLGIYLYKKIQKTKGVTDEQVIAQINVPAPLAARRGKHFEIGSNVSMLFPDLSEAENPDNNNVVEKVGLQGNCIIGQQ